MTTAHELRIEVDVRLVAEMSRRGQGGGGWIAVELVHGPA
jgi:hypothetical protein